MKPSKSIIDGRCIATVLYFDRKPMPRPDRLGKQRERRVRRRVLRVVLGAYWWKAVVSLAVLLGGAAAVGYLSSPLIRLLGDMGVPLWLAGGFSAMPYLLVLIVVVRALKPQRYSVAVVFIQERICPSCLYDLQNLPPQEDGCTVCPECGAAWRLP
jgi:hypothetical protein